MGNLLPLLLLLMRPCNLRQPHMFSFVIKMFDNFIRDPSSNKASGPRYDPHRELIPIVRLAGWQSWHTLNLSLIPPCEADNPGSQLPAKIGIVPCSCLIINMWDLRTSHLAIPCTTSPPTSLFLCLLCFWLFNLFLSRVKSFLKCFQFLVSVASSLFWFNAGFKFAYVMDTSGICTLYFRSDYRYFSIRLAPLWGGAFPIDREREKERGRERLSRLATCEKSCSSCPTL